MPDARPKLKMVRMTDVDLRRLEWLKAQLELPEAAIIRMALRELARAQGYRDDGAE